MKKFIILLVLMSTLMMTLSGCGGNKTATLVDVQSYLTADYPIDTIIADGDSDNIILKVSNEDSITVKQYNSEYDNGYFSDIEIIDTVLTITEGKKPIGAYSRYMEIYIPIFYQGSICITNKSGKITAENDVTVLLSDFEAQTTSGKIEINNIYSSHMYLSSNSGKIDISNCTASAMTVSSRSGKILMTLPIIIDSFSISAKSETGSIACNFLPDANSTEHSLTYNTESDSQYNFLLSTTSGAIEIAQIS